MKKVKDWYNDLPNDIREKALANTSKDMLETVDDSLVEALSGGFTWSSTEEGHDYWESIVDEYEGR